MSMKTEQDIFTRIPCSYKFLEFLFLLNFFGFLWVGYDPKTTAEKIDVKHNNYIVIKISSRYRR